MPQNSLGLIQINAPFAVSGSIPFAG